MIRYTQGNIFESSVDAIVNTVNIKGVMGKGLALQFKRKFPENFNAYSAACKRGDVIIGKMFVFEDNSLTGIKYIINFPTKTTWRSKSKMSSIVQGLTALRDEILQRDIKSIAIPPLGCGLGGLAWPAVKAEIEKKLSDLQHVDIVIYEPLHAPSPSPVPMKKRPKLTSARALLLKCFEQYMRLVPSDDLTFVEAHKLSYMLQDVCGVKLKLDFRAWRYGPYAHNLPHVLENMEGVWISGYRDGTSGAFDRMRLLPAAKDEIKSYSLPEDYAAALSHVDTFFYGFESALGLELLATTHWLVVHEHLQANICAIQEGIASWGKTQGHPEWGKRKQKYFKPETIKLALDKVIAIK